MFILKALLDPRLKTWSSGPGQRQMALSESSAKRSIARTEYPQSQSSGLASIEVEDLEDAVSSMWVISKARGRLRIHPDKAKVEDAWNPDAAMGRRAQTGER